MTIITRAIVLMALLCLTPSGWAGTIGGGNQGRCEMLASEATPGTDPVEVCTGKGRNRTCITQPGEPGIDTFCGGAGNDGSCSCAPGCESTGTCCADYAPVCQADFGACAADSEQMVFLHVGGMCSTQWDYAGDPDRLASTAGISGNAASVELRAVQTSNAGTQVAARTLTRYLDQCCTDSNDCVIYNYSNGDNVVGYTLDRLAPSDELVCTGKRKNRVCGYAEPQWNILDVRTSAGAGGGSELSNWGGIADLFACDLASELNPSTVRNLYNHSNTNGVPVKHVGGFLDQVGSDDGTLNAAWYFLPWHSDGAVAYHSAGARNQAVGWRGGEYFDWSYFGTWVGNEDLCDMSFSSMYQGHQMAFCPMELENSDHYDQKMYFILRMGQ